MQSVAHTPDNRQARDNLQRLLNGFHASQALHVAATLGLADHLRNGRRSASQIAEAINVKEAALYRLMRALASIGVLREGHHSQFELTNLGEFLRTDIVGTLAPMAAFIGRPNVWSAWGDLLHSVQTGETAFDHVHGCNVWDYRSQYPEETRIFDRAMSAGTERFADAVLDACDFGRFAHVVDVGGGDGRFLSKILTNYPRMRGTLFDQPHVIARATASQLDLRLGNRCRAIGGDFFKRVPQGGDAYLLKWILHDWSDDAAIQILRCCRRAMNVGSRILVAEYVIGPGNTSPEGSFMDLMMMVMCGGRERTRDEFASMLSAAGFRLAAITPTATPLSLIEGIPCETLEVGAGNIESERT
jgi:O-methyltransferase domain/Dimerisation domain